MKAYISCQLGEPLATVLNVRKKLIDLGYTVSYYVRDTPYSDKEIRECDAFILVSQDTMHVSKLTRGCKGEVELAHYLGKSIYMVHSEELHIQKLAPEELPGSMVLRNTWLNGVNNRVINNTYQLY